MIYFLLAVLLITSGIALSHYEVKLERQKRREAFRSRRRRAGKSDRRTL